MPSPGFVFTACNARTETSDLLEPRFLKSGAAYSEKAWRRQESRWQSGLFDAVKIVSMKVPGC
jgi:hypothetical protein